MTAYAWFIMGQSFVTTALVFGVWFSYAVVFVAMVEAFDWSRGGAAMAFSVGNVVQAAVSPLVGMLTDRWGPRVVVVGGLGAIAVGVAACSLVQALWHLIVLFGVVVGLGVGLAGQVSHAALLSRWFIKRRGTMIGFAFAGMGLGVKVMGPLSQALMSCLGWRYAFVVLGGITALYALAVLLTLRNRPEDVGLQPYGADGAADPPETAPAGEAAWTVQQALRTRQFWALGLAQVLIPLGIFPVSVHQVAYLTDLGFSRVLAAGVLGYMGVMSSCGRLLFGALSDRLGRFGGVALSVVFSQIGILALLMLDDASVRWPLYLYAVCFGLGYGARGPIISAIAADRFPGRSFATIFGVISIGHGLGGALGPWYGGAMYDRLGSYTLAFVLACVSLCGVSGCFWVATRGDGRS
jgi:MFS family permease